MEILDAKMKKGCRVDLISPRFHAEPRVAWKEEETEKYDVTEHSSFSNSIKIHKVKLFFEKKNYYSVISINENSNRSNSSLSQRIIKKKKTCPSFISFHFVTHYRYIVTEMEGMRACIHMHGTENTWPRDVWN